MGDQCAKLLDEMNVLLKIERPVPVEVVQRWMDSPCDEVRSEIFDLLMDHQERLQMPPLQEVNRFFLDYLECRLREDPTAPSMPGRYMAGHILKAWFERLWKERQQRANTLKEIRSLLALLVREGDSKTHDAIVTAILEHLFERSDVVAFFSEWKDDPSLSRTYEEAIALSSP